MPREAPGSIIHYGLKKASQQSAATHWFGEWRGSGGGSERGKWRGRKRERGRKQASKKNGGKRERRTPTTQATNPTTKNRYYRNGRTAATNYKFEAGWSKLLCNTAMSSSSRSAIKVMRCRSAQPSGASMPGNIPKTHRGNTRPDLGRRLGSWGNALRAAGRPCRSGSGSCACAFELRLAHAAPAATDDLGSLLTVLAYTRPNVLSRLARAY